MVADLDDQGRVVVSQVADVELQVADFAHEEEIAVSQVADVAHERSGS